MLRTADPIPPRWIFEILLCFAILVAWVASGCTTPSLAPRIEECLIGPDPKQDPVCDGFEVPWGTTRYVCHRLDDHEAYRARCQP